MAMTRKQNRVILIATSMSILCVAVGITLFALSNSTDFFLLPSQIEERGMKPGIRFRLGGLVKGGSDVRGEGTQVRFAVKDGNKAINVAFNDILPDLFKEGQGVIAEGKLLADGSFLAVKVLAKHDENYMPKDISDELKKQGVWQGKEAKAGN